MSETSNTMTPAEAYQEAANNLGVELAAIQAVAAVESGKAGFLPSGRPVILFEAHIFERRTNGRFKGAKDRRGVLLSSPAWDRSLYGQGGEPQWERLQDAAKLDSDAAHESCSWGRFQIMGFHWRILQYTNVGALVAAAHTGSGQLDMFVRFIKVSGLAPSLRAKDWATFARRYNGPGYAENKYDAKLQEAHQRFLRVG